MANWELAPTLQIFRKEVNAKYPNRNKSSDGTIGNAAHQATKSDHNPDSRNVVCAFDLDEDIYGPDSSAGQELNALKDRLIRLARDGKLPQLYYIIYERKIYSRTNNFNAKDYNGVNAHTAHMHLSVYHTPSLADRKTAWNLFPKADPNELGFDADDVWNVIF